MEIMDAFHDWHEQAMEDGTLTPGELALQLLPGVRAIDMLSLAQQAINPYLGYSKPGAPGGYGWDRPFPSGWIQICNNGGAGTRVNYHSSPTATPLCGTNQANSNFFPARIVRRGTPRLPPATNAITDEHWYAETAADRIPSLEAAPKWIEYPASAPVRIPLAYPLPPGLPAWVYPPNQPKPVDHRPRPVSPQQPNQGKRPALKPYQRPALVLSGGGTARIGVHNQVPPGKREREKKGRYNKPGWLETIISGTTETVDIIEALDKSLPPDKRCRGGTGTRFGQSPETVRNPFGRNDRVQKGKCTPQAMAANLWKNADHINVGKFAAELIRMQAEDKVFGILGQGGANLARKAGWLVGPQTGFAM